MIEFSGYLTGAAQQPFYKRSLEYNRRSYMPLFAIGLLSAVNPYAWRLSASLPFAQFTRFLPWIMVCATLGFLVCLLETFLPQKEEKKQASLPKRVFTEEEYILCSADNHEEYHKISEVKSVRDYGEFYELIFPMSKAQPCFICQKSLLTQGSLDEFEHLFVGKIVSMQ